MDRPLRIGTRGSPLALAQTHALRDRLAAARPALAAPGMLEVVVIKTSGDRVQDRALAEIGGKGLFTKEIEEALLDCRVDLAVHSMKDVPTWLPPGLEIAGLLPREDPRDAFFARGGGGPEDLPEGAVLGTSSPRRAAQVKAWRPDLRVALLRGNVDTRLRKLADGAADATLLAVAGLKRLGREALIRVILAPDRMLPAVGQGAIGVECRSDDALVKDALAAIHCPDTGRRLAAERALLAALDGSCRTPIGGLADLSGDRLTLQALVAEPDGGRVERTRREGAAADAEALGTDAGEELRARIGPAFFEP
jgi:hydroxymethylbilane synthase